jgi:hypothetical protein
LGYGNISSQQLDKLQTERNKFVHERHRPKVGLEDVKRAHSVVDATIVALCEIGAMKEIPGRYSCVHPTTTMILKDFSTLIKRDI